MPKHPSLSTAVRLGSSLGINAVPAAGLLLGGWAPETAMLLYLLENLIGIPLAALRLRLLAPAYEKIPGEKPRHRREAIQAYLVVALGFSVGSAVFMAVFLFLFMDAVIEPAALRTGLTGIVAFQLVAFLSDLIFSGSVSLAQVEKLAEPSLGRIFLLYLAVFMGVCAAPFGEWLFLAPFIALKTMVDVGQPIQFLWERVRAFVYPQGVQLSES